MAKCHIPPFRRVASLPARCPSVRAVGEGDIVPTAGTGRQSQLSWSLACPQQHGLARTREMARRLGGSSIARCGDLKVEGNLAVARHGILSWWTSCSLPLVKITESVPVQGSPVRVVA